MDDEMPIYSDGNNLYCELCGEVIEREGDINDDPFVLAHTSCVEGEEV